MKFFWGGTDLHASPTIAEDKIFTSSNIKEYYAINAMTGEFEWTYRNDQAGEFILCSPIYNEGRVFFVDHFSIVCVDSDTGNTIWSTYLGYELYVSPTFSDNKLYVVTDQRSVHVLNATTGEQLSFVNTGSNSWSSPSVFEDRIYVGNNDWNLYCFAENPATVSNLNLHFDSKKIDYGDSISGIGQLMPSYPNQSIILTFIKPDGSLDELLVTTTKNGSFSFDYKPDLVGDWIVNTNWESEKSYYTSIQDTSFNILVESINHTDLSAETIILLIIAIIIIVAVIGIFGVFLMKRKKPS